MQSILQEQDKNVYVGFDRLVMVTFCVVLYTIIRNAAHVLGLKVEGMRRYFPGASETFEIATPETASEYRPDVARLEPELLSPEVENSVMFNEIAAVWVTSCKRILVTASEFDERGKKKI
jgi:hypothetical protein